MDPVQANFHIWATLAFSVGAIILYATERLSIDLASLLLLAVLLVFFQLFPVIGPQGENLLPPEALLAGFANPALITVLSLLVIGQGVARTGVLNLVVDVLFRLGRKTRWRSLGFAYGAVFVISAFISNTPVVVMFIPVISDLSRRLGLRPSDTMMPLSFVAILAGMTTLIGTSTNLLISGTLVGLGHRPLGFFEFAVPGLALAAIGIAFLAVAGRRLLPWRGSPAQRLTAGPRRRFVLQLAVTRETGFVGETARPHLLDVKGARLLLVQRGERALLPPFQDRALRDGDVLVLLATREAMEEVMVRYRTLFRNGSQSEKAPDAADVAATLPDRVIAEVMIAPGSRLVGQTLEEIGFRARFGCVVLGIERRAHVIRQRMTEARLETGDVLVVEGTVEDIERLRASRNLIVLDGSTTDSPAPVLARRAALIVAGVLLLAATGTVPIAVAAFGGATLMVATGILGPQRAAWALDRRLILLIGATLALGTALQATGGALFFAQAILGLLGGAGPAPVLSALFLLVALLTNVISNNATAILFTPIAVNMALALGENPVVFALAVLFGANCSFATPIGYQTNLLVMGPGHYRFGDFLRLGGPLALVLWLAFSLFTAWHYGLD